MNYLFLQPFLLYATCLEGSPFYLFLSRHGGIPLLLDMLIFFVALFYIPVSGESTIYYYCQLVDLIAISSFLFLAF